jgi:uncharacterized membrane protein YfcA
MEAAFDNLDLIRLLIVCLAMSAGGFVKGVASFGLPTVAIPILTFALPLPMAIAVMVIPMFLTNLYQMKVSGYFMVSVKRHWPLIVSLVIALLISIPALKNMDAGILLIIAGTMVSTITFLDWHGITMPDLNKKEKVMGPIIGAIGGLIGGVTTFFGLLPIFYFVALKIPKEQFISAVSLVLVTGSLVMVISLNRMDILTLNEAVYAVIGMVPLFIAMWLGTILRSKIPQELFRLIILGLIFTMGIVMISKGVVQTL